MHENEEGKACHYFNNGKKCPFEVIGCKFRHVISAKCPLGKSCQRKMCQFTHESCEIEPILDKNTSTNEFEELPEGEIYCSEWKNKIIRDCCEIVLDECDSVNCVVCKTKICKECSDENKKIPVRKSKHLDMKDYCSKCKKNGLVQSNRTASSSSSKRMISLEG